MTKVSTEESQKTLDIMANDEFKTNFSTLLKARYPIFYITTNEEKRLLEFLGHFCRVRGYQCYLWDCYKGLIELSSGEVSGGSEANLKDPQAILDYIITDAKMYINDEAAIARKKEEGVRGIIYVLLDYFRFLQPEPDIERRLKEIAYMDGIGATIITGPSYVSTNVTENLIPVIDFPYANKEEIKQCLWQIANSVTKIENLVEHTKEMEEELINSVRGLTLLEAGTAFSKSIVRYHNWDIPTILQEKKQIISKSNILDYYDQSVSMDDVGGLKNLVNWISERKDCFSEVAEKYGLRKPRGVLTIGMPGAGKSLVCKAISSVWNMPLLKMDFGKLFGSLVGQSEERARECLKLAEAVAPCVSYDTLINTKKGAEVIGNIYDKIEDKKTIDQNTTIATLDKNKIIYAYDEEKNTIVKSELKSIIRRKIVNKKVYKVTLESGKTIKVSEDHKFLLFKNGIKTWEKIKELKETDEIVTLIEKEKILKIEEIHDVEYVYDPCCTAPHSYISNSIISHNCILWLDEIEKGLSGIKSSGQTDGGTTSRVLSTFLTWMQEKTAPVFVVATANDHASIPPEFLRAGRFDEIFFVDLPNPTERQEIFSILLRKRNYKSKNFNLVELANASNNYSGAEIEKAIDNAMIVGFRENQRKIVTKDIINSIGKFKSLYNMREDDFMDLRDWANEKCLKANAEEKEIINLNINKKKKAPDIDIDLD